MNMLTTVLTNCHLRYHPLRSFNFYEHFLNEEQQEMEEDKYPLSKEITQAIEKYYGNDCQMTVNENCIREPICTHLQCNKEDEEKMEEESKSKRTFVI